MPRKASTSDIPAAAKKTAPAKKASKTEVKMPAWNRAKYEAEERPVHWNRLYAKALRLSMLIKEDAELQDNNFATESGFSWWFDDFDVRVTEPEMRLPVLGGSWVRETGLYVSDIERIERDLDSGFEYVQEFREELARKRKAEELRQQKIKTALAKLDKEEIQLLGIGHLVRVGW